MRLHAFRVACQERTWNLDELPSGTRRKAIEDAGTATSSKRGLPEKVRSKTMRWSHVHEQFDNKCPDIGWFGLFFSSRNKGKIHIGKWTSWLGREYCRGTYYQFYPKQKLYWNSWYRKYSDEHRGWLILELYISDYRDDTWQRDDNLVCFVLRLRQVNECNDRQQSIGNRGSNILRLS